VCSPAVRIGNSCAIARVLHRRTPSVVRYTLCEVPILVRRRSSRTSPQRRALAPHVRRGLISRSPHDLAKLAIVGPLQIGHLGDEFPEARATGFIRFLLRIRESATSTNGSFCALTDQTRTVPVSAIFDVPFRAALAHPESGHLFSSRAQRRAPSIRRPSASNHARGGQRFRNCSTEPSVARLNRRAQDSV
jgi:hypothetical protein